MDEQRAGWADSETVLGFGGWADSETVLGFGGGWALGWFSCHPQINLVQKTRQILILILIYFS